MSVIIKQKKYELLPVGQYTAKIIAIELSEGHYGTDVRFEFEIQGGDYAQQTFLDWAPATFSSRSKLYGWTRAALNANIPESYDFNGDDLLGRLVRISVVHKAKKDGTLNNRVESMQPNDSNEYGGSRRPPPSTSDELPF